MLSMYTHISLQLLISGPLSGTFESLAISKDTSGFLHNFLLCYDLIVAQAVNHQPLILGASRSIPAEPMWVKLHVKGHRKRFLS